MINILVALLLSGSANAVVVEKTVAIVNSEVVLESDFKKLEERAEKPGMVDDALLFNTSISDLKKSRQAQLNYLINEKILESEIKRLNLSVTSDRVDQELQEMAKRNNVDPSELVRIIKSQGISLPEYREFLKNNIEKKSLMDTEIISKLRVSDEDALNEYIKTNPNSSSSIDEFSVSHIFFDPKKGGAEAALKRAEATLSKLRSGQNFETLAQQYSEDPNFSAGGSLGTFKSGEFLPEIESSISTIKVGETTPVVKSRMGYHIVKLTNKKITTDPKFARSKDAIKARLLEASFKRQLKQWLQSKRDESFIRINE